MKFVITGKIQSISQTVNVSKKENAFYKRELVLNAVRYDPYTGEERNNYLTFTFAQKNCEKLDVFKCGDVVDVAFVLQGREYQKDNQTKYINDIVGYEISAHQSGNQPSAPAPQAPAAPQAPQAPAPQAGGNVPF